MYGWLIRAGAQIAPFAYGWMSNDLTEWMGDLNPFDSEDDEKAIAGWSLSAILLFCTVPFLGYKAWERWIK